MTFHRSGTVPAVSSHPFPNSEASSSSSVVFEAKLIDEEHFHVVEASQLVKYGLGLCQIRSTKSSGKNQRFPVNIVFKLHHVKLPEKTVVVYEPNAANDAMKVTLRFDSFEPNIVDESASQETPEVED